jgi:transcription elongation factor GreA
MAKKFVLTKEGLANLQREYDLLVKTKRPQVTQRIQNAREFGDLAENSEYDAAKEEQSLLESRISELENVLKRTQLIEEEEKGDFVVIGSTVVVEIDNEKDEFTVVGTMEADPAKRRISNESPVGAALLGARVGEVVEVATPIIRARYKILEIK